MDKLSDKHLCFCEQLLVNGFNQTDAYKVAYPKASQATAEANAAKLMANTKIQEYIQEKKNETSKRNAVTKDDIIKVLVDIMRKETARDGDKIKAANELNKMCGFLEAKQIESTNKIIWKEELFDDEVD